MLFRSGGAEEYYASPTDYTALGSCLGEAPLRAVVNLPMETYCADTTAFVQRVFPESTLPPAFSEQDGLLRRIMVRQGLKTAFACQPRCSHVGYYSYHRPRPVPQGTLTERVSHWQNILRQPHLLANEAADCRLHPAANWTGVLREVRV